MERIVNGHYADPNSTRDIVGITPKEYEKLIDLIQTVYAEVEAFYGFEEKFRDAHLRSVIESNLEIKAIADSEFETIKEHYLNDLAEKYKFCYELLQKLNQPYPGADYSHLSTDN